MCLKQIQTTGFGHHSITILFLVFRDQPQSYVREPVLCGCLLRCILFCLLFQFLFQFFLLRGNIINKKGNSVLCVNVCFVLFVVHEYILISVHFIVLYCSVTKKWETKSTTPANAQHLWAQRRAKEFLSNFLPFFSVSAPPAFSHIPPWCKQWLYLFHVASPFSQYIQHIRGCLQHLKKEFLGRRWTF